MTILVHFCLLLRGRLRYITLFTADFSDVVYTDLYRKTPELKLQKGLNTISLVLIGVTVNVPFFEPDYLKELFPYFQSIGNVIGPLTAILPIAQPILTIFSSFTPDNLDNTLQIAQAENLANARQELAEHIEEFHEIQGFAVTEIIQLWDQFLGLILTSAQSGYTANMSDGAVTHQEIADLMNDELLDLTSNFHNQIVTIREDFQRLNELAEEIQILVFNLGANFDVHETVILDPIAVPSFVLSLLNSVVYLDQGFSFEYHTPYILYDLSHPITNQGLLYLLQEYGSRSRAQARLPFDVFYHVWYDYFFTHLDDEEL